MIKARHIWLPIVLALIVVGCRSPKPAQKGTDPKKVEAAAGQPAIATQLQGQWKVEGSDQILIFANTGSLYSMNQKDGTVTAAGSYRLDATRKPMVIAIDLPNQKVVTLIELPEPGKMRILLGHDFKQPLPASMPQNAERLVKVSETATVPEGLRTVDPKQKQFESEGKTMVGAMNRSTQAFFMEKSMFPTAFSQLAIGSDPQSPNYQYDVKSIGSNGIQLIGRAKSAELRSYTGGVFVISVGNEKTTVTVLCEATKPGMGDLPAPQLVNNQPTCSEGTVSLSR
jgi:hypothetical protein